MKPCEGLRDESGVALALAIMVVVVVGVMGAGLLLFVRGDLESAVQTNQGQRAFYAADAGVQAARRNLLSDAIPEDYDDDGSSTACDLPSDEAAPGSSPWSEERGGYESDFSGGEFTVTVRLVGPGCDPPGTGVEPGLEYFEVVSEGIYGDARRRIQSVYAASEVGAPLAVHASGDVELGGESVVRGGSVFSGGDVTVAPGAETSGDDAAYGDWSEEPYNETPRETEESGIGAVGVVSGGDDTPRLDSTTTPAFVAADADEGEVSYPFSPGYWGKSSRSNFMVEEAVNQRNFFDSLAGFDWPEDSDEGTVVYVDLSDAPGDVRFTPSVCADPDVCRGTLVVEGGGVVMGTGAAFGGNLVTLGEETADLGVSIDEGALVRGSIESGGDLSISGEVEVSGAEAYLGPGLHGTELQSWRELYE